MKKNKWILHPRLFIIGMPLFIGSLAIFLLTLFTSLFNYVQYLEISVMILSGSLMALGFGMWTLALEDYKNWKDIKLYK